MASSTTFRRGCGRKIGRRSACADAASADGDLPARERLFDGALRGRVAPCRLRRARCRGPRCGVGELGLERLQRLLRLLDLALELTDAAARVLRQRRTGGWRAVTAGERLRGR